MEMAICKIDDNEIESNSLLTVATHFAAGNCRRLSAINLLALSVGSCFQSWIASHAEVFFFISPVLLYRLATVPAIEPNCWIILIEYEITNEKIIHILTDVLELNGQKMHSLYTLDNNQNRFRNGETRDLSTGVRHESYLQYYRYFNSYRVLLTLCVFFPFDKSSFSQAVGISMFKYLQIFICAHAIMALCSARLLLVDCLSK